MDLNVILDFILQHGLYITILVLILVCLALGLSYLNDWFKDITKAVVKAKSKYLDKSIVEIIQFLVIIIFSLSILAIIILVTAFAYPSFKEYFWDIFSGYFTPIVTIVIILIIISILGQVIHRFFRYLRIALKKRPGAVVKSETTRFIELSLVYVVYIIGLTIVVIIGLSTIGLSDPIRNNLINFFENNLSPIILIVIGLVIIYAVSKFITAFVNDLKTQSTRYNPNTLELSRNLANYVLLIIAILLVVLSIFSFTGLSGLGTTLLTTIIIVVGIIIAISASSTLGNFFAGLVLMFTSPFEHGDTIKIGNGTIGKVQTKALFSTNVITEEGEEIKFPNSRLLDSQIVNYSNSQVAPLVVDVKVNYKVTSDKVHSLLLKAAEETEDIDLADHPPKVYTLKFEPTSIKYRLRVNIKKMTNREEINSELLQNIQNIFNEADVSFQG